jgi:hypothetical protein
MRLPDPVAENTLNRVLRYFPKPAKIIGEGGLKFTCLPYCQRAVPYLSCIAVLQAVNFSIGGHNHATAINRNKQEN